MKSFLLILLPLVVFFLPVFTFSQTNGNEKIPITPLEMMKRLKDVKKILEWSKNKHLIIMGPPFFGPHHIYIDGSLKHVVILPKEDKTTHVVIGDYKNAEIWRKYDKKYNLIHSQNLDETAFEWKIYQDIVLYKGPLLPPKTPSQEPYWGKVIGVEDYNNVLNDEAIISKIKEIYTK